MRCRSQHPLLTGYIRTSRASLRTLFLAQFPDFEHVSHGVHNASRARCNDADEGTLVHAYELCMNSSQPNHASQAPKPNPPFSTPITITPIPHRAYSPRAFQCGFSKGQKLSEHRERKVQFRIGPFLETKDLFISSFGPRLPFCASRLHFPSASFCWQLCFSQQLQGYNFADGKE